LTTGEKRQIPREPRSVTGWLDLTRYQLAVIDTAGSLRELGEKRNRHGIVF